MKEVVGYVQDMTGKNKFLLKFYYSQKRDISDYSVQYLYKKHEFGQEIDKTTSDLLKRGQCEF